MLVLPVTPCHPLVIPPLVLLIPRTFKRPGGDRCLFWKPPALKGPKHITMCRPAHGEMCLVVQAKPRRILRGLETLSLAAAATSRMLSNESSAPPVVTPTHLPSASRPTSPTGFKPSDRRMDVPTHLRQSARAHSSICAHCAVFCAVL